MKTWTKKEARKWLKENDFLISYYDKTDNYHAFRQNDPDEYKRIRSEDGVFGQGTLVHWGITPDDTVEAQSIWFYHGEEGGVKRNPELLIINPDGNTREEAWSEMQEFYDDRQDAIRAFAEMYPDSVAAVNIDDFKGDPDFEEARQLFKDFHGREPDYVIAVDIPQMEPRENPFLVVLGETPADSYYVDNAIPGSTKEGHVYVHPYESGEGNLPLKVVSADGELIMTLPGNHFVSDWIRG